MTVLIVRKEGKEHKIELPEEILEALWNEEVELVPEYEDAYRSEREHWYRRLYQLQVRTQALKEELKVAYELPEERDRVMEAIPECPQHGSQCVSHALGWIRQAKAIIHETNCYCKDTRESIRRLHAD